MIKRPLVPNGLQQTKAGVIYHLTEGPTLPVTVPLSGLSLLPLSLIAIVGAPCKQYILKTLDNVYALWADCAFRVSDNHL